MSSSRRWGIQRIRLKVVITSHTHLDHVGNIAMFPKAIHVLQKKERHTLHAS